MIRSAAGFQWSLRMMAYTIDWRVHSNLGNRGDGNVDITRTLP